MAVNGRATICSVRAWSAWISRLVSASGISRSCIIPIWDYDLSSAPILADITVDGKAIKAVALPSKEAFLYVFDRVTGKPVWPIEERPVPQSDVPGEKTSPTQPFPTKPPAYARNYINVPDDLIDFTPEMRAQAKDNIARYKTGLCFFRRW